MMSNCFCVQRFKRDGFKPGDFLKSLRTLVAQRFQRCFKPGCLSTSAKGMRRPEEFRFAACRRFYLIGCMGSQPCPDVGGVTYIVSVIGIQDVHVKLGATQFGVAFFETVQMLRVMPVASPAALVATVAPGVVAAYAPPAIGARSEPGQVYAPGTMATWMLGTPASPLRVARTCSA